jgi:CTP:molybdopterin cytidylyltransferase MocA
MTLTLVILAAGMSSRYGEGLKQVDGVGPGGETLLDYAVFDALRAGFRRIVYVIRPDLEPAFRTRVEHLPDSAEGACVYQSLDQVPQGFAVPPAREKPWGTGHAALAASSAVTTPFVVINADDFYGASAYRAMAAHFRQHHAARPPVFALVGYRLKDTLSTHGGVSRAVIRLGNNQEVTRVFEVLDIRQDGDRLTGRTPDGEPITLTGDELVSMSCWGFTPAVFPMLDGLFAQFIRARGHEPATEFLLPNAVSDLVASGRARLVALPSLDRWCGMTARQDRNDVRRQIAQLVERGEYPLRLFP